MFSPSQDLESPWDEDADQNQGRDSEWARISSQFTNAGYREGITAGKEGALQSGFDSGFANVGVPLGRELGQLRGSISAIVSFLSSRRITKSPEQHNSAREIASALGNIRYIDIAPRDLEAEAHAREHLDEMDTNEELADKRKLEQIEDILAGMSASGTASSIPGRPTSADVAILKARVQALIQSLGLNVARQQ